MVAAVVTFCQLVSAFTEYSFERAGRIRMRVAEVAGLEGVGEAFSSLLRLWKCVEKFKDRGSGHLKIERQRKISGCEMS
jgi:hypothetical protein